MATSQAVWQPKSKAGGINDNQTVTLTAATSSSFTVGVRQKIMITASGSVNVRFSLGASSAVITDFLLPFGTSPGSYLFETGDEFDTVSFFPFTGTPTVSVMRLSA